MLNLYGDDKMLLWQALSLLFSWSLLVVAALVRTVIYMHYLLLDRMSHFRGICQQIMFSGSTDKYKNKII